MMVGTHDEVRMRVVFALLLAVTRRVTRTAAYVYVAGWLVGGFSRCIRCLRLKVATVSGQVHASLSPKKTGSIPRRKIPSGPGLISRESQGQHGQATPLV